MKKLLLVAILTFTTNANADFIDLDATNSGYYTNSGSRNGNVSGIFAGNSGTASYRNWVAFDLSVITDNILSASLTIYNNASNDSAVDFTWSEVTTSVSEVFTSAGDGIDTFNDLNDGSVFAAGAATSGSNNVFSLNSAALSALNNANGYWLMGGATVNNNGMAYGFTNGVSSGDLIRLTVEVAHIPSVPVPAAFWLFGSGLIGVVAVARRRQH